ncbi:MAG: acyl-CoA dehydrogenase family protein [Polyangiaceae bacterium]
MTTAATLQPSTSSDAKPIDAVRRIAKEIARANANDVDQKARFPIEAITALREQKLMSALVPKELGGAALTFGEVATMCELLASGCASTGMVFAMHQIQVACIARHGLSSPGLSQYLREVVEKQYVIASVTSEVGVGGEMRTRIAAVSRESGRYAVYKAATTISSCELADDLLLTARRAPEAPPNDQVLVLLKKGDYKVERTGNWDTMGMRGTCSPSFKVFAQGPEDHVLPAPFADIASHTMVPVSHVLWASVWLGIASSAVSNARAFVRQQARSKPGTVPPTAVRLAELSSLLQTMRTNVHDVVSEAEELMTHGGTDALSSISFALKMNNLKVAASQQVVQVVQQALLICGIMGYKNDSPFALGRHLRDAHSAALMVGNDRILATNAQLLLVLKED